MPFLDDEGESVTRSYMERHVFSNKDMFRAVLHSKIDFRDETWDSISSDALDFVKRLLKRDPKYRPTAQEALDHLWLKEGQHQKSVRISMGMGTGASTTTSVVPFDNSIVQRLQRFGTYGKLKQAALKKVASFVADDPTLFSGVAPTLDLHCLAVDRFEEWIFEIGCEWYWQSTQRCH